MSDKLNHAPRRSLPELRLRLLPVENVDAVLLEALPTRCARQAGPRRTEIAESRDLDPRRNREGRLMARTRKPTPPSKPADQAQLEQLGLDPERAAAYVGSMKRGGAVK